ncbi:MAG TPA: ATP synthase F0 subunit C [Kiritimatiellia bacterium]|nr:ATP synthase F0 subunit C [Kiritimatiellia bacterium]HRU69731.1 ATP synthase F0 subunit C [Kiritimatiellia bacterium]
MMIPLAEVSAAIGAGIVTVGAGLGIGALCAVGLQSMARQPELQPKLQTAMIIGAAFIEGAALFALVICLMKG